MRLYLCDVTKTAGCNNPLYSTTGLTKRFEGACPKFIQISKKVFRVLIGILKSREIPGAFHYYKLMKSVIVIV